MSNDAQWVERKGYRSLKSVPAVAALSFSNTFGSTYHPPGGDVDRFSFDRITFASFARSGAEVVKGLLDPQEGDGDFIGAGQVEECRRTISGRPIDAPHDQHRRERRRILGCARRSAEEDTIYTGSLKGTLAGGVAASADRGSARGRQTRPGSGGEAVERSARNRPAGRGEGVSKGTMMRCGRLFKTCSKGRALQRCYRLGTR